MEPGVVPATVRATGAIASAALGRYRPAGVARIGSPEDRAQAYRRFLNAIAYVGDTQVSYFYAFGERESASRASLLRRPYLLAVERLAWRRYCEAQYEVHGALLGVRLCASAPVLAAAEEAVKAIPRPWNLETRELLPEEEYLKSHDRAGAARTKFLEEARHDLAYNPKPWQFLRKRRERKHRKASGS